MKLLPAPVIVFFRSRRDLLLEISPSGSNLLETERSSSSHGCFRQTFLGAIASVLVSLEAGTEWMDSRVPLSDSFGVDALAEALQNLMAKSACAETCQAMVR
jgi:hypothetical protein